MFVSDYLRDGLLSPAVVSRTNLPVQEGVVAADVGRQAGCKMWAIGTFRSVFQGRFQMNFSRRLELAIVTGTTLVFMFGYVTVGHSVDPFHILHYLWMALYFLVAMVVMFCADLAFQRATGGAWWGELSRDVRYAKHIGDWATKALVLWLAFWHQDVFVWIVFALALTVLFRIGFRKDPLAF